ncbi:cobalt-precorrin 5A hydrolase [Paraburkholderia sp. GAS199]|uniref:cobalamin biosynthesis protein n=1 Tax=Paraburkholderia sp. GAS199 TaxID=3035126 RepID=UPI003D249F2C
MKTLTVGIGCRRGASAAQIEAAVQAALGSLGVHDMAGVGVVATVDLKSDEAGLREFCTRHALPLTLFGRAEIAAAANLGAPGLASCAARTHLGVDGVCEPCAVLAATQMCGATVALALPKTAFGNVTVAIATTQLQPDLSQDRP